MGPQGIEQTIFLVKVKENYFMIVSIIGGIASSCKAVYDAYHRALEATGAWAKLRDLEQEYKGAEGAKEEEPEGAKEEEPVRVRKCPLSGHNIAGSGPYCVENGECCGYNQCQARSVLGRNQRCPWPCKRGLPQCWYHASKGQT